MGDITSISTPPSQCATCSMMDGANLLYAVKAVYVPCRLPSACWVAFRLHGRPTEFSAGFLSPDAGEPIVLEPKMTEAELLSQMDTYRICDFQTPHCFICRLLVWQSAGWPPRHTWVLRLPCKGRSDPQSRPHITRAGRLPLTRGPFPLPDSCVSAALGLVCLRTTTWAT